MGLAYEDKKDFQNAKIFLDRAIEIQQEYFGFDHPDTLRYCNSLATLYCETQEYDDAIIISEILLVKLKKMHGDIHPEVSDMLYNLAVYHWNRMVRMGAVMEGQRILIDYAREDKLSALEYALQAYINAYQYYDEKSNPRVKRCYILLEGRFTRLFPCDNFDEWLSERLRQETEKTVTDKPDSPPPKKPESPTPKKPGFFERFRKKKY
jgi:tetratricopeptide (TPR) repeat protein